MLKYTKVISIMLFVVVGFSVSGKDRKPDYTDANFSISPIEETEVEPEYPRRQLIDEVSGWVYLGLEADIEGNVTFVRVIDSSVVGRSNFRKACVKSVKKWRFAIPKDYDINKEFNYTCEFNFEK